MRTKHRYVQYILQNFITSSFTPRRPLHNHLHSVSTTLCMRKQLLKQMLYMRAIVDNQSKTHIRILLPPSLTQVILLFNIQFLTRSVPTFEDSGCFPSRGSLTGKTLPPPLRLVVSGAPGKINCYISRCTAVPRQKLADQLRRTHRGCRGCWVNANPLNAAFTCSSFHHRRYHPLFPSKPSWTRCLLPQNVNHPLHSIGFTHVMDLTLLNPKP